jgi:hypothetical protein
MQFVYTIFKGTLYVKLTISHKKSLCVFNKILDKTIHTFRHKFKIESDNIVTMTWWSTLLSDNDASSEIF